MSNDKSLVNDATLVDVNICLHASDDASTYCLSCYTMTNLALLLLVLMSRHDAK